MVSTQPVTVVVGGGCDCYALVALVALAIVFDRLLCHCWLLPTQNGASKEKGQVLVQEHIPKVKVWRHTCTAV